MEFCSENTKVKITNLIRNAKNIVIIGHNNPDGDAVGGCLGLYTCLKNAKKKVHIILPNDAPSFIKWLPGYENSIIYKFKQEISKSIVREAELIFFIDFNSIDRMEGMEDILEGSQAVRVVIDHHPNPDEKADFLFSFPYKSSASEIVFDFVKMADLFQYFDKNAATCIYTGIMTDTINFSVNSSNRDTFLIVAELMSVGINKDEIYNRVYNYFTSDRIKLVGWVLYEKLQIIEEYGISYMIIDKNELDRFNFKNGDQEGIVNIPLSIKNINASIFAMEKEDHIKLSLRSKKNIDVNVMSGMFFNGGGHKNAAGGKIFIKIDQTEQYIINAIKEFFKSNVI